MTGKERFQQILERRSDRCGFWHGHPNDASTEKLYRYFGVKDDFSLGLKLGSDVFWAMPDFYHMWPSFTPMFDTLGGKERVTLNQDGVFAGCEDIREVDMYHWPDPVACDFTGTLCAINRAMDAGQAVLSGTWSPFFHVVCDFFGMENYFVKMYTDPDIVTAVTEHVVDFYLAANERLFALAENKIDAFFFGNDFGSQLDLLISPELFDKFIMPYFIRFTEQAHNHGLKVILHSCGSIERVIPRLIGAGVEALHPIQALAANMDAETLSKKYNGRIVFMGGVDTQRLLPYGTPGEVRAEVRRLRSLFGPNYIVSPSHESILPNVPPENVAAMAEEAHK